MGNKRQEQRYEVTTERWNKGTTEYGNDGTKKQIREWKDNQVFE